MTRLTLIVRSMARNPTRSGLLCLSVAVAFFVYFVLGSFENGFSSSSGDSERLVVTSKSGASRQLPISHYEKIRSMEGVAAATFSARSRATFREPTNYLGLVATDPTSFASFVATQYSLPAEAVARLAELKNGALVGRSLSEQEAWKVGQTITLNAFGFPKIDRSNDYSFEIVGIFDERQPGDTYFVIANYEYINVTRAVDRDTVSSFGVVPSAGIRTDDLISAIDDSFANSPDETRTQTESQFMKAFLSQFADVSTIVRIVSSTGFATVLMIVTNTMFFAMRERTREIGVLKVLGFSKTFIFAAMLAETVIMFAIGLALAYAFASLAVDRLQETLSGVVPSMHLSPAIALSALAISLPLALLCGGLPAISAARVPPSVAMRGG